MIHSFTGAAWLCMHEGVRAAHRLLEPHVDLGVGVADRPGRHDLHTHQLGDLGGQLGVGPAREQHQVLDVGLLEPRHRSSPPADLLIVERRCPVVDLLAVSPTWRWSRAASAARAVLVPARLRATQPGTLRCRPRLTASSPGPTSEVIVEPAATYAPSAMVTGAPAPSCCRRRSARPTELVGLVSPRRSWRRSSPPRCWRRRRSRCPRRRSGAAPWPRPRSGRSWSRRRCRSCRPRPSVVPGRSDAYGPTLAPAPITDSEPCVRITVAPSPTSTSTQRGVGADGRPGGDRGRALQRGARQQRDIRCQVDRGVHPGRRRVDHRHPALHPAQQDPAVHLGVHPRQLDPVVDAFGLPQVIGDHGADRHGLPCGRNRSTSVR